MEIEDTRPLMVSIRCTVYNHERYLRDCLNGFVMQKTNFRFEAIVHDDASTDGSAAIIREYAEKYPEIIKPIYETENQYSKHDDSLRRIMNEHTHGKYIAFCEGDDYWTDPLKLQKQVDFLEANPDYGACYTNFEAFEHATGKVCNLNLSFKSGNCYEEMIKEQLSIWTLTNCMRAYLYFSMPQPNDTEMFKGDRSLFLHICANSKVKFLPCKTARYRILENSASHFTDKEKSVYFMYTLANCIRWWLKNGPRVSRETYRYVATQCVGRRRIKYAIMANRLDVLQDTEYSFFWIRNVKDILYCFIKLLCTNKSGFRIAVKVISPLLKK